MNERSFGHTGFFLKNKKGEYWWKGGSITNMFQTPSWREMVRPYPGRDTASTERQEDAQRSRLRADISSKRKKNVTS